MQRDCQVKKEWESPSIKAGAGIFTGIVGIVRIFQRCPVWFCVWQFILKKAIGTRKNRKKHDNCGFTSKAEATIWVKPKRKILSAFIRCYPPFPCSIAVFRFIPLSALSGTPSTMLRAPEEKGRYLWISGEKRDLYASFSPLEKS
jgi:hypothetical protein